MLKNQYAQNNKNIFFFWKKSNKLSNTQFTNYRCYRVAYFFFIFFLYHCLHEIFFWIFWLLVFFLYTNRIVSSLVRNSFFALFFIRMCVCFFFVHFVLAWIIFSVFLVCMCVLPFKFCFFHSIFQIWNHTFAEHYADFQCWLFII